MNCMDCASRFAFCIPIPDRKQVHPFIQKSILQFMAIFYRPTKIFISDNSQDIMKLLNDFNTQHQPSTPYQEQENAFAERINQTFMNGVGAALYTADLPPTYWHYEVIDMVDKYNYLYHTTIGKSPFIVFYNAEASCIRGMHIFGELGHCPSKKQKNQVVPEIPCSSVLAQGPAKPSVSGKERWIKHEDPES